MMFGMMAAGSMRTSPQRAHVGCRTSRGRAFHVLPPALQQLLEPKWCTCGLAESVRMTWLRELLVFGDFKGV